MLLREGLCISSPENFEVLFAPVFPGLKGLMWLMMPDSFCDDERLPQVFHEVRGEPVHQGKALLGTWTREDLFPTYAELVSEDWSFICASPNRELDAERWFARYYDTRGGSAEEIREKRAAHVAKCCSVCFLEVDGAHWEFYASDNSLIDTIREHWSRDERTRLDSCDFRSSSGL